MITYPEINVFAIIVGFIINNAIGFLWYNPNTPTGKFWMKAIGKTEEEMNPDVKLFGLNFFFSLVTTWGIALVVAWSGATTLFGGLLAGLFVWWAFTLATSFNTVVFEDRSFNLWVSYGGYQLVVSVILGIMFAVWT